jgi:hypothetical protein
VKIGRGIVCSAGPRARLRIEKRRGNTNTREKERSNASEVTILNGGGRED